MERTVNECGFHKMYEANQRHCLRPTYTTVEKDHKWLVTQIPKSRNENHLKNLFLFLTIALIKFSTFCMSNLPWKSVNFPGLYFIDLPFFIEFSLFWIMVRGQVGWREIFDRFLLGTIWWIWNRFRV